MALLPDGVTLRELHHHGDGRGVLTEGFRSSWTGADLRQFNVVVSEPGVLRGVHVHFDHTDHLVQVSGRAVIGLHDCRRGSATFGLGGVVALEDGGRLLSIPPGVAHGFWMPAGGLLVYGLDVEWTPEDELGCRWDDPALGIDWSALGDPHPSQRPGGPSLSRRDAAACPLSAMLDEFDERSGMARSAAADR